MQYLVRDGEEERKHDNSFFFFHKNRKDNCSWYWKNFLNSEENIPPRLNMK